MYNRPWPLAKKNLLKSLGTLHSRSKKAIDRFGGMGGKKFVLDKPVGGLRQVWSTVGEEKSPVGA
jgi:hypothetical protein